MAINHYVNMRPHLFWIVTELIFFTPFPRYLYVRAITSAIALSDVPEIRIWISSKKKVTENIGSFVDKRKQFYGFSEAVFGH